MQSIIIPESVTTMGDFVFDNCISLTTVDIPASVSAFGAGMFRGCSSLTAINVAEGNASYTSVDGVVYSKDKKVLVGMPGAITSFEIPEGVTEIAKAAFEQCKALTNVSFSETVEVIGEKAFNQCSSLTAAILPDVTTTIGSYAFAECSSLKDLSLGKSLVKIEPYTFYQCKKLETAVIGDAVTVIEEHAFYDCTALKNMSLGNSVEKIGKASFGKCSALTSLTIPATTVDIANFAFQYCSAVTKIYALPSTPPTIGYNSFDGIPTDAVIYVKNASKTEYAENAGWKYFSDFRGMGELTVAIDRNEATVAAGKTVKLEASIVGDDDVTISSTEWSSSDAMVATVDESGLVSAVSEGKVSIILTVVDNYGLAHTAECVVTVTASAGIEEINADNENADIYTMQGVIVKRNATIEDVNSLAPGLYIVGHKKVLVK